MRCLSSLRKKPQADHLQILLDETLRCVRSLPHNICGHPDGDKVIVADRENNRGQVFDFEGNFIEQSPHHRAVACAAGSGVNSDTVLIAEQGSHSAVMMPGGREGWGQPGKTVR